MVYIYTIRTRPKSVRVRPKRVEGLMTADISGLGYRPGGKNGLTDSRTAGPH